MQITGFSQKAYKKHTAHIPTHVSKENMKK